MVEAMKTRWMMIYWLGLVFAALCVAGLFIRLFRHEQERLGQVAYQAAAEQARSVADHITRTVAGVQDGLLQVLQGLPAEQMPASLRTLERENPLVRLAFAINKDGQTVLPDPRNAQSEEEQAFLRRMHPVFRGPDTWPDFFRAAVADESGAPMASSTDSASGSRQALALARRAPDARTEEFSAAKSRQQRAEPPVAGWLPWVSENRLHLIGWVRPTAGDIGVYGVELELAALLSMLLADLPTHSPAGMAYTLTDDGGTRLYQRGGTIPDNGRALFTVSLAPRLPHWEVAVFQSGAGAASGRLGLLLAVTLAAILLAAIVSGGTLLLWQARRHVRDAAQKTSFVANVSHELKTPLTTIRLYSELLAEGRVAGEEKRARYLRVMAEEAQRLTRLVNNVLDFSRLEQARKQYTREAVDLPQLAREVADSQQCRAEELGLRLEVVLPEAPVTVRTDRDAVSQTLLNLLDNAFKYAAGGGQVQVEMAEVAQGVELRVMDRGPGIPREHQEKIFEKFYRIDDSLTTRKPGAGLGLSIARRMMRDLGGELRYAPRPGGGACFTVFLPHPKELS
jgi:signal transduction histidine kinase